MGKIWASRQLTTGAMIIFSPKPPTGLWRGRILSLVLTWHVSSLQHIIHPEFLLRGCLNLALNSIMGTSDWQRLNSSDNNFQCYLDCCSFQYVVWVWYKEFYQFYLVRQASSVRYFESQFVLFGTIRIPMYMYISSHLNLYVQNFGETKQTRSTIKINEIRNPTTRT